MYWIEPRPGLLLWRNSFDSDYPIAIWRNDEKAGCPILYQKFVRGDAVLIIGVPSSDLVSILWNQQPMFMLKKDLVRFSPEP